MHSRSNEPSPLHAHQTLPLSLFSPFALVYPIISSQIGRFRPALTCVCALPSLELRALPVQARNEEMTEGERIWLPHNLFICTERVPSIKTPVQQ